jgi:hypothetical protein
MVVVLLLVVFFLFAAADEQLFSWAILLLLGGERIESNRVDAFVSFFSLDIGGFLRRVAP